jgi:hypothetical protein
MNGAPPIRTLVVACVLVVALAVPALAPAAKKKTYSLSGPATGDANGKVSLKVVVKNGKPKKIKGLAYENLDAFCRVDESTMVPAGEFTGSAGTNLNPPGIEPGRLMQWFSYPENPSRQVTMNGKVSANGKTAKGTIGVFNNEECGAAEFDFTAKK